DGADLVRVNGAATQGDAFEVAPNGAGLRFQRTNLVPFTIDLDTERIEMNTLAGADPIAVKPGLAGRACWLTAARATIASRPATARPIRSRAAAAPTAPSSTYGTRPLTSSR